MVDIMLKTALPTPIPTPDWGYIKELDMCWKCDHLLI